MTAATNGKKSSNNNHDDENTFKSNKTNFCWPCNVIGNSKKQKQQPHHWQHFFGLFSTPSKQPTIHPYPGDIYCSFLTTQRKMSRRTTNREKHVLHEKKKPARQTDRLTDGRTHQQNTAKCLHRMDSCLLSVWSGRIGSHSTWYNW